MKLISMKDFVFHLRNMTTSELCKTYPRNFKTPVWNGNQDEMVKDMLAIDAIQWKLTGEYAKFLSQPLTLSMFVPTDEDGNVLTEPLQKEFDTTDKFAAGNFYVNWKMIHDRYNEAKERVLFEGFIIKEEKYELPKSAQPNENKKWSVRSVSLLHNDRIVTMLTQPERAFDEMTIESLLEHFPALTETATTQIFG